MNFPGGFHCGICEKKWTGGEISEDEFFDHLPECRKKHRIPLLKRRLRLFEEEFALLKKEIESLEEDE